jgi:tetrahydromethanopterin S-methyltransferase subunit B
MKKLIIAIAIVVPLIIAAIGTSALAASPPDTKPVDALNYIVERVDEILTAVNNGTTNILTQLGVLRGKADTIIYDVGEVDGKIDELASDVADIKAGLVQMETYSGDLQILPGEHDTYVAGNYTEIRHVVVTMRAYDGLGTNDTIDVSAYWPGNGLGAYVAQFDDSDPYACKTFEFNADYWTIHYDNAISGMVDTPFYIRYSVTTTYVPAPEP